MTGRRHRSGWAARIALGSLAVAGGLIVWGPWGLERLSTQATQRLGEAYQAIDLKPRNGVCDNLRRPPNEAQRAAFARIVTELRRNPNAELVKLVAVSQPTVRVREFAQAVADQNAGCFARVNRRAGGWDELQRHLTSALAQT
jgi:hypothetical protein